jgi:hypothetical protein
VARGVVGDVLPPLDLGGVTWDHIRRQKCVEWGFLVVANHYGIVY